MADRLSQLQTCLDQLVTQFFSSLNYVNQHHEFVPTGDQQKVTDSAHEAFPAERFDADLHELSRDIVVKVKQIETLLDSLPGIDTSENTQMEAVGRLEQELAAVQKEKQETLQERQRLLGLCNDLILRITKDKVELDRED